MVVIVRWSVILAASVAALTVVWNLTGLHTNPLLGGLLGIAVAVALNVWSVFMALKGTAERNSYGGQLFNALLLGLVAAVLVFASSWVLMTWIFPHHISEMIAGFKEWIQGSGLPEEQIQAQIAAMESTTPSSQALNGGIGTLATSLISGAIVAIFKRRK